MSDNDRRITPLTLTTTELEYRRKPLVIPFVGVFDQSVSFARTEKARIPIDYILKNRTEDDKSFNFLFLSSAMQ